MPHSVSSTESPADDRDDEILPDAPTTDAHSSTTEDKAPTAPENQATGVRLEDMFSDEDNDEEFPASNAPEPQNEATAPQAASE
jgi:DNA primase small subunit